RRLKVERGAELVGARYIDAEWARGRRRRRDLIIDRSRNPVALGDHVRERSGIEERELECGAEHPQRDSTVVENFAAGEPEPIVERLDHVEEAKGVGLPPREILTADAHPERPPTGIGVSVPRKGVVLGLLVVEDAKRLLEPRVSRVLI